MELRDFVKVYTNKKNKQVKLEVQKSKIRDAKIDIKDILSLKVELNKKMENFDKL